MNRQRQDVRMLPQEMRRENYIFITDIHGYEDELERFIEWKEDYERKSGQNLGVIVGGDIFNYILMLMK